MERSGGFAGRVRLRLEPIAHPGVESVRAICPGPAFDNPRSAVSHLIVHAKHRHLPASLESVRGWDISGRNSISAWVGWVPSANLYLSV